MFETLTDRNKYIIIIYSLWINRTVSVNCYKLVLFEHFFIMCTVSLTKYLICIYIKLCRHVDGLNFQNKQNPVFTSIFVPLYKY